MHPALALLGCILVPVLPASAQVFRQNTTDIPSGFPGNNSYSESVDFGDVDLDGDWDAYFADGGDFDKDQNRLWINQGGLQGGALGVFADETATRLPAYQDVSRDADFGDLDGDGALDLVVANTSDVLANSDGLLFNAGFVPVGSCGFSTDETSTRYVGLAGPGSSVNAGLLHLDGGFIDWSNDVELADVDNDGDLDLLQSSSGSAFNGKVPTRIFRNDGAGFFSELNPSGAQLAGTAIPNGTAALWAEGTQFHGTTNTTGAFADIADTVLDLEVGDLDGDFDLDFVNGGRVEHARVFRNLFEETGSARFRDVTHVTFSPGHATGDGHYEHEMGDLDDDGDLDLLGINWAISGFSFDDRLFLGDGLGSFTSLGTLASSSADDNEGDFLDYDNDGDLDAYVANFAGVDRLYRNDLDTGTFGYSFVPDAQSGLGNTGSVSLDAEVADVDGDGDYDVFVACNHGQANFYMENVTEVPDTTAPRIPHVEALGATVASTQPRVVRAHVYDNAPYYITQFNETSLQVRYGFCLVDSFPMQHSGAQVFRGELPGNLVGNITYTVRSEDEHGNAGFGPYQSYTATAPTSFALTYGAGNPGAAGTPVLEAASFPTGGTKLYLVASGISPQTPYILTITASELVPPVVVPGIATLNVGGTILLTKSGLTDVLGCTVLGIPLSPNLPSGVTLLAQAFGFDGTGGFLLSSSRGLSVTTQ